MPLERGAHLGPHQIESPIGAGGMGEAYRAHDPKLQRTVAIKVLAKQDDDASAKLLDVALKVLPQAITEVRRPVLKDGSSWLTFRVNSFN